jgi:hypothetical protein
LSIYFPFSFLASHLTLFRSSPSISPGSCKHCSLACFLSSNNFQRPSLSHGSLFGWHFDILSHSFPSTINFPLSVQIFKSCKPIKHLNVMLLFTLYLIWLLDNESLHMKSVQPLFIHCCSLHQQTVVSITICCPEWLDMKYIRIWQIWLWVFPSGDVQVYLWMLWCANTVFLTVRFLAVAKFTTLTPLSLLIFCKLPFRSTLPTSAFNSLKIYVTYLGYLLNTHFNSS